MTERIRRLYGILKDRTYRTRRANDALPQPGKASGNPRIKAFSAFLDAEVPQFFEDDRIGFYRYRAPITSDDAWYSPYGNIVPNYARYLEKGFGGVYVDMKKKAVGGTDEAAFAADVCTVLEAMKRYFDKQRDASSGELREVLTRVPWQAPKTYHEALVIIKAIQFFLRCNRTMHVPIGRFDQYMYPFFKADLDRGVPLDELFELTEEFFLSLNFDADLYDGIQQGDNGQSMVLGGFDKDGKYQFNELSKLCLDASIELNVIDPKINLRVGKDTPRKIYDIGTKLTKKGLGFPQ